MSVAEYVGKMKTLGDEMASAGMQLDEEELVHYILIGIDDMEYNPVVSAVLARPEPISVNELLVQLQSFERRLSLFQGGSQSSANSVYRGGRSNGNCRGRGRNNGGGRGRGNNNGGRGRGRSNGNSRPNLGPRCQVCLKPNHTAMECWHLFDEDYVAEDKFVAAASSSYGVDTNWYKIQAPLTTSPAILVSYKSRKNT